MADLSVAANAFAVVGLADVIFRAGTQLYGVLFQTLAASENGTRLLSALKSLTTTIAEVRRFANEFKTSLFVLEDGGALPVELENILKRCESELKQLKKNAGVDATGANGGWVAKWKNRLTFVLNNGEILRSCQMLEAHKTALIAVLAVNNSDNATALRNECKRTRTDISDLHNECKRARTDLSDLRSATDTGFQDIKLSIAGCSSTTQTGVEKMTGLVQASTQETKCYLQEMQSSLSINRAELRGVSTTINKQSRTLAQQYAATESRIASNIEDATALIQKCLATLTFTETGTTDILVEGRDLQHVIIPLTLMRPNLANAVQMLVREESMEVSQHDADWIQDELANLLASAHERAAQSLSGRRSSAKLSSSQRGFASDHPISAQRNTYYQASRSYYSQAKPSEDQTQPHHKGILLSRSRTASRTQVGLLVVESNVRSSDYIVPGKCYRSLEFRFYCVPRCSIVPERAGIIGVFSHQWVTGACQPRVTRFVRVVNVVPRDSETFRCVRNNDVMTLRRLLMERSASPYDYGESGRSLLCEAAMFLHFESVELLLQMRADPHSCHLGASPFNDLSYVLWRHLHIRDITGKYKAVLMACPMAFQAVQRRYGLSFGKTLEAAAGSESLSKALTHLIKQRGSEVRITGEIMIAIGHDREACKAIVQLLKENDGEIKITEAAMRNSVLVSNREVMMVLLDQMAGKFKITEEMLEQAARYGDYRYGKEVFALLLRRSGRAVKITKILVENIAGSSDAETMMLLLDKRGAEVEITEEVIGKAANNRRHGKEMMVLLLKRCDTAVKITKGVVISVAQLFDKELMALILDREGAEVEITEEVIEKAANNHRHGKEMMVLLLKRCDTAVKITKGVVISVARLFDKELMALILDRDGAEESITNEILEATTTNREYGKEIIMLLLERSDTTVKVIEKLIERISSDFDDDVMMLLLDRYGTAVEITENMLKALVRNCGWEVVMRLLKSKGAGVEITEEKSEIAVASRINELERARRIECEITEAILKVIEESVIREESMIRKESMIWEESMIGEESMRMVWKEGRMIRRGDKMMRIVEEFDRMVELELRDVMDMGIDLWEAPEANRWRRSLAQKARNLGIIGIKALFFAANS